LRVTVASQRYCANFRQWKHSLMFSNCFKIKPVVLKLNLQKTIMTDQFLLGVPRLNDGGSVRQAVGVSAGGRVVLPRNPID
jgi:hypothetical protein